MSSEPLAVAVYSAYEPHSVNERPLRTHELLEGELCRKMERRLRKATRNSSAKLHYAASRFAKFIVVQGGVKLIGWPSDIPYVRFSHIRGGIATLRKLLALWNDRKIRFVRATSEDIANAKRDPRTVLPSYRPPGDQNCPASAQKTSAMKDHTVVPCRVLHLEDLSDVGVQPTSTQPSAAAAVLGHRLRGQRSDTKKPRHRDVSSPYARKRKLPKEGIKSEPFILPPAAERTPMEPTSKSAAAPGGREWPVSDPLPQFLPVTVWNTLTSLNNFDSSSYFGTMETKLDAFTATVADGARAEGN